MTEYNHLKNNIYMNKKITLSTLTRQMAMAILLGILTPAAAYAQKVNLSEKTQSVKQYMDEIEKQTGFLFFYSNIPIDLNRSVNLSGSNDELHNALKKLFAGTGVGYKVVDKTIVLTMNGASTANDQTTQQNKKVTGKVTDAQGEFITGATIKLQGSNRGTVTDGNGRFSLDAPAGSYIEVSFIGYHTQRVKVSGGTMEIILKEDNELLDEVVVIGYGTMKRRDLTGSVSSVSADEMKAYPVSNPLMGLQGRVPGAVVTNNTGDPKGDLSIRIRGTNSIKGSNDPLYIVDGMPANISSISSQDIKSVEILKDASATAIYGSRGANGVILITTNSGQEGTHVTYNATYSVQKMLSKMDVTDGAQYAAIANEIRVNDGGKPYFTDEEVKAFGKGFDWQDAIFRSAPMHTHNLSISSGNSRTKILISGSAMLRDGIIKDTGYKKLNLRSNINHDINEHFHVDLIMSYARTKNRTNLSQTGGNRGNSLLSAVYFTPSILTPYNEDGTYCDIATSYPFVSSNLRNPIVLVNETDGETNANLTNINGAITYKPFKGFSIKSSFGLENNDYRTDNYITSKYMWGTNSASVSSTTQSTLINENIASFEHTFNGSHNVNVMGGFTYQKYKSRYMSLSGSGFISDAPGTNQISAASNFGTPSTSFTEWVLMSGLGRLNYSYKSRYMATFSIRADGSSRYSEGSKWGYFPSAALAWRISDEPFMKRIGQISNLKLRVGYGETGSTAINPYATLNMLSQGKQPIGDGVETYYTASTTLPSDLKWETTAQWNVGVDLALFDNRLRITADYYDKTTRNLLNSVSLPSSTGYSTTIKNIGKMSNRGFEFIVDGDIVRNSQLLWSANANIAFNKNKVISIYDGQDIYSGNPGLAYMEDKISLIREGEPMGVFFTYKEDGYDEKGNIKYVDVDGDGNYTIDDKSITGDPHPDFTFGFGTSLSWKNFDFSVFFQGSYGNDLFNITEFQNLDYVTPMNYNKEVFYSHWSASNTEAQNAEAKYPRLTSKQNLKISDRFVEDGSYLRMKDISLGYNLPVKSIGIDKWVRSLKVYVSAQNLLTLTNYSGQDPEVNSWGSDVNMGFDFLTYPSVKTITFGAKIEF